MSTAPRHILDPFPPRQGRPGSGPRRHARTWRKPGRPETGTHKRPANQAAGRRRASALANQSGGRTVPHIRSVFRSITDRRHGEYPIRIARGKEPMATADRPIDGWTDRTASDGCVHSRPGQFVELNDVVGLGRPREGRGGSDRWKSSCVAVTATEPPARWKSSDRWMPETVPGT